MNFLTDQFPTSIKVGEQVCEINYDWRTCLNIVMAFEDNELAAIEKQLILLASLYKDIPINTALAFSQGMKFLNCGKDDPGEDDGQRLFSWKKDEKFIFAAFRQTHGIDLETVEMHWWKFYALFMDLGSETAFCKLTAFRKRVKDGTATKEERAAARAMGDLFEVPDLDNRSLEEREAEALFMSKLGKGN